MKNKFIVGVVVLIALVAGFFASSLTSTVGGTTNFDTVSVTGLQVGTSGTTFTNFLSGTVNCTGPDVTMISGKTSTTTCAVTGAASGDRVFITPPAGHVAGLLYEGIATTSNVIGVVLYNATTTSVTVAANSTSSVGYLIVR